VNTPATRRRGGAATLDEALPTGSGEAASGQEAHEPPGATAQSPRGSRALPDLPTEKTGGSTPLEHKTILVYGDRGVGKSSLAASFGDVFFFDCAGELGEIEAYKAAVTSWEDFRLYGAALKKGLEESPGRFVAGCIDTVDVLAMYCAQNQRARLGIAHESDAEWGKGWTMVKESFLSNLAKLCSIPGFGVILVSHAKQIEIKTPREVYNKSMPTLTGGIRDVALDVPDLVLFIDYDEEGARVIRTKPGKTWEAKERGTTPRLPATIPWPLGRSGYEVLKEAWDAQVPG
jgi:hypothetical protein